MRCYECAIGILFNLQLRWLLIDEAHLVMGDTVFRSHYELLCNLRAVLRRETVWAAVSGSVPTALRPSITRNLGFLPGYYVDASYSQDLPHVKYITRFLSHSTTQGTFHDLSWLIPPTAKALADIPQAIVFVDTITQDGLQLERYLDGLLDRCLPHDEARKVAVRQYNSILTPAERTQWAEDFNNGSIRIGIVTESFIYGLDLDIDTGISLGLVKNKTVLKQRRGRVGRRRPGKFILYSPRWVSTAEDTSPLTTAKAKENFERRHQMDPDILAYCNPTLERCSRAVDLDIYGDTWPPDKPWSECSCETHQPGDNATHDAIVQQWLDLFRNDEPKRTAVRSDGTYKPIKSSLLKKKLVELITSWRLTTWYKISPESHIPAPFFLPTSIIQKLVDKAHVCGADYDAFATIASDWRYLPQHGQLLFNFLHHAMEQIDDLWSEVVNSAEFQEVEEIDSESDSSSSDHSGSSQPLSIPRTDSSTSSSDASLVSTASTTSPPPSPPSTAPLDPAPIARLPLALIQPPEPLPARLSDGNTSSQENSIPKGCLPSRTSSKRRSPSRSPVAAQKKRRIQKK